MAGTAKGPGGSLPLSLPRRRLLAVSAAALCAPVLRRALAAPAFTADPFSLGIASGCPRADRVVLWTRLAPDPLNGGGMPDAPVEVEWQVAEDEGFARVVAQGVARAVPEEAHSVHAEPAGLAPGRWYWYRFRAGDALSPVGRTRTALAPGTPAPRLRLAIASCQQYEQGYYAAYRDMAAQELDLVVHVGDYIYEMSWGTGHVRRHGTGIPTQLGEYRNRYALYKSDADLQAAHAAFPWLVTWDDHEVANDYAGDRSPAMADTGFFLRQRAAAYRAYWEHMPLPAAAKPAGPEARLYEAYRFGDMAEILMLDDRQHRSPHACLAGQARGAPTTDCPERLAAERTMLGPVQEEWLDRRLASTSARWTVIAQQTLLAEVNRKAGEGEAFWMDGWDGYPAARQRLLDSIARHRPANPVVVGGDVHSFWIADLKQDFARPDSPVLASEIVGGSITSQGPREEAVHRYLARNPHLKYGRGDKRGYALLELGAEAGLVRLRAVDDVADPRSPARQIAAFAIENGRPGAVPA